MKKILVLLFMLFSVLSIKAQEGDSPNNFWNQQLFFTDDGNNPNFFANVEVRIVSVPFEGYTNYDGLNRYDEARYGCIQRRYYRNINNNEIHSEFRPITFANHHNLFQWTWAGTSHTSAIPNSVMSEYIELMCGFAKYKYTFTIPATGEVYSFYFDYTDSKYGKLNYFPNNPYPYKDYISRWKFKYNSTLPINHRLEMWKVRTDNLNEVELIEVLNTVQPNIPIPDYKVWELTTRNTSYYRKTPFEEVFYIRATPFPTNYEVARDTLAQVSLFTTAVMDQILPRINEMENSNVNTYTWYYENPIIPVSERPFTSISPGIFTGVYDPEDPEHTLGMILRIRNGGNLVLGNNIRYGIMNCDKIKCEPGSVITLNANSKIFTGSINNPPILIPQDMGLSGNIELDGCNINGSGNSQIELNNDSYLAINGTVILDNVILDIKQGAVVKFGQNAKLIIRNGGSILANNITFSGIESAIWNGIEFDNASSSSVTGCTFNNCSNPIRIYNDITHASNNFIVINNIFNLSGNSSDKAINAENIFSLNVQGNTFNLGTSSIGIYIKNYYNSSASSMGGNSTYNLNIRYNSFFNGTISLVLASYASALTPYIVDGNVFSNNSYISVLGRMLNGSIKNNTVTGNASKAFFFYQSSPDLYNNSVSSVKNIFSGSMSAVNLTPLKTTNGLVWTAGRNNMTANSEDNIEYNYGNTNLDNGFNSFSKSGNCYHLYGYINTYDNLYYVRNNCFNNSSNPVAYILNLNGQPINIISQPSSYDCAIYPLSPINWVINNIGYGQYDSLIVTALPSGSQLTPDDQLYSQAEINFNSDNYFDAINNYKTLINQYPDYSQVVKCAYSLYECHERLDTVSSQSSRDILYGSLLNFFNDKINSGLYSNDFNDVAYNLTLNCYAKIEDYNSACDGYEFISLYHPNPEIRLLASWDYAEVQAIIGTGGAISSKEEKMTNEEFLKNRIIKQNESIKGNPIKEKMKNAYMSSSKKHIENTKKQFSKLTKEEAENKIVIIQREEGKINNKAIYNLRGASKFTKTEKDKSQFEDLLLTAGITDLNKRTSGAENVIPMTYELSQNYPNPFNPVTNIKFQLPKVGFVSLKVFDITGREIAKLVSEQKQAGYYTVSFNGSNFASGVYFYRIQAGDFVQVKKMVLVK